MVESFKIEITILQLTYMINHVFPPPNLPDGCDANDPKSDAVLPYCVLEKFCGALEGFNTDEALCNAHFDYVLGHA
jgi:hypothetical protein